MRKQQVIEHFKGKQVSIARALNLTPGAISQWGEIIPEAQAMKLERITGGALVYDPALYSSPNTSGAAA